MDFIIKHKSKFIWFTLWIIISFGMLNSISEQQSINGEVIFYLLLMGGVITAPIWLFYWVIKGVFSDIIKEFNKMKDNAQKRKEEAKKRKEAGITIEGQLKHINGLPIPENSICSVISYTDKFVFSANGLSFNLLKSKITDICIKTDIEISKQVVSSIGGAIGGAVLFGPLGAIIGGRAKNREIKTTTQYLIFTYIKDNDVKYLGFIMDEPICIHTAYKIVDEFIQHQTEASSSVNDVEIKEIDL